MILDEAASVPANHVAREESLFAELDGLDLYSGTSHWLARVLGVHTKSDEAWVQLSLVGQVPCSLIVHLFPRTTAAQAIDAISSWLECPSTDRPEIVDVS